MSGQFYLDWAVMAVSLFNTILLFWLSLTVLLNAEHRTWAIWLASGGLLMGGVFFFTHSAILIQGLAAVSWGMDFWWHIGWMPIIALPVAWYAMTLWYVGFLPQQRSILHRRHKMGLVVTVCLAGSLIGLLLLSVPLPSFWQVTELDLSATLSVRGVSLLIVVFPIYALLCISLSLDALRRPGPARRMMADLARRRARPWLVAASVALLLASLFVAGAVLWIIRNARPVPPGGVFAALSPTVAWFDLVIATLIAAAILTLGQAVVSYEVFTGKTLPRGGLRRYWRNAIILAAGYGLAVGLSLTYRFHALYSLLLSLLLITLFFALLSWRSFAEREWYIGQLRPFVSSQRLYEHLVFSPTSSRPITDATTTFQALCRDVLGVRVAYLMATGALAPLVGASLSYPEVAAPGSLPLSEILERLRLPEMPCIAVDPDRFSGAHWAVPLWSERGLIGVLFLGEKRDGGLYTQEEIEVAQASGERMIDTQASAEMARRLMALQRQRLAESQVLDRRARRTLHDDILPRLHTAMLFLNGLSDDALVLLTDVHRKISDLLHEMPASTVPELARLGLVEALHHVIEEEYENAFDNVTWHVEPVASDRVCQIPPLTAEVVFFAAREGIRNAARHGRGADTTRPLHLDVIVDWLDGLRIVIQDNGIGIGAVGEMNPQSQESGQGLALHSTMMAVVGGALTVESETGAHTRVVLNLPEIDNQRSPNSQCW